VFRGFQVERLEKGRLLHLDYEPKAVIAHAFPKEEYTKYVYEYPTRCNDNNLVLFQGLYMFRVPAVPIIGSTILQLAVTGITYITLHLVGYSYTCFE
jgi:hypothetical protein